MIHFNQLLTLFFWKAPGIYIPLERRDVKIAHSEELILIKNIINDKIIAIKILKRLFLYLTLRLVLKQNY